ncbi:hypothetical protein [Sulfurospirillum sp.]|uniref:hypothetical protein n=1 Tax=Sulfurospirillum sp. TaxID=2053622 RepID=UPI002FDD6064
MSSLYPLIPSFAGVIFCYLLIHFNRREENALSLFLSFLYLCLYDLTKGFYFFSYILVFAIFYKFAIYKIQNVITCNNCILAVYVTIAYLGHFLLNAFFAYLDNESFPYFSNYYFYYIAIDSLVSFMLFKVTR